MAEGDGYGQQRPEQASSDYNAQSFMVESILSKISTVKIVKVLSVDTEEETVSVLPLVEQMDGNGQVTPQGPISGVPYMQWRYGKNAVLADPAVDDIGVLLCCDRDISTVKETSEAGPPGSQRQYDQADGIYLGGVLNTDEPEQWVRFNDDGLELHDNNNHSLVSSPTGWLFTGKVTFADDVVAQANFGLAGTITDDTGGNYTGDITCGTLFASVDVQYNLGGAKVTLKAHRHSANNVAPTPGF